MVIISFCIDLFYFQSLQQGLRGKSREKIIAHLSGNGKLIAAVLAAYIGQGCYVSINDKQLIIRINIFVHKFKCVAICQAIYNTTRSYPKKNAQSLIFLQMK